MGILWFVYCTALRLTQMKVENDKSALGRASCVAMFGLWMYVWNFPAVAVYYFADWEYLLADGIRTRDLCHLWMFGMFPCWLGPASVHYFFYHKSKALNAFPGRKDQSGHL